MSEIKRVKIGSIIESQIPEFLSVEAPLLVEFLTQYYKSMETQSGSIDIISNIFKYKNSKKFNKFDLIEQTTLTSDVLSFDETISVTSTKGWPDSYGLLKINDEIITYTSKTETSFKNCIRGFSGIENLKSLSNPEFAVFTSTKAAEHSSEDVVHNLSNLFLTEFFEKFKYEFLPGFESRDFYENLSIENISYKIKDLYSSKGTDQSYKLLFKILYGSEIEIIKPQEFTLTPSSNSYFITKNILVEKISGGNPIDIKGNFLFQNITGIGTVSASIFNVEYRPVGDKDFYEISLDSTSFSGNFEVSGKTRILENVAVNSNNILVDSTVGFANSGSILVKPENSDFITIDYTGKNINQFTGVTNVTKPLNFGLDLIEEKFAFSYIGVGNTSKVEFRVVNVIDNIDFSKTSNLRVGDTIALSGFGRDLFDEYEFNSWMYNLPTNHNIKTISQVDSTKYRVLLFDKVYFYVGETILLVDSLGDIVEANIIDVEYSASDIIKKYTNTILIQVLSPGSFSILNSKTLRKQIYKVNHYNNYFGDIGNISAGVQNTYIDSDEKYFYVTSSGLPNYTIFSTDNKKIVSTNVGSSSTDTFNVSNHNFLSGELVYYSSTSASSGISTGLYYTTKVDNNKIKLSYSKSDVFSKKYIEVSSGITNDILYKSGYQNKTLLHQKLLKKFPFNATTKSLFDDLNKRTTFNRELGMLINGVEILSPTLFDENIYYGAISSVDVTNSGQDYDVIDVPPIEFIDETGTSTKAHLNLSGTVKEIKILNAGYGYQEKPKITITGGNGVGCALESNFVTTRVSAGFKADVNVTTADNTIQFLNSIPFEDGEEIVYDSNKNNNIPGIVNSSIYFVGILTDNKIKLFNNKTDALQKINEIDIVGVSSGFHYLTTLKNKNTFTKIYVKDPGKGYSNRKVKVPSVLSANNSIAGINTFDSYIYAKNHGFSNGEYVIYQYSDTPVSGLSSSLYYQVKVIDNNKFRLYNSGVSTNLSNDNYLKDKFVKFSSLGIGTHIIGYPPIEVHVEAKSSIGSTTVINSELKPIVLGSIDDVYLEDGGIGYGCTNIINYHRRPITQVASVQSEALLKPIIIEGSIVDVQIISRGRGFRENSEIIVSGKGNYAQLEPIVENGQLMAVNIVFGGVGYESSNTTLTLKNRGRNAKFLANVTEWKINQVVKSRNILNQNDDGILHSSKNPELQLQFINFYVPKILRYQLSDNFTENNKESTGSLNHSPILGYAYDGNPIYGPYAYDTTTGGTIRRMSPGYVLNVDTTSGKRPPLFENGFFINDYLYDGSGDLDVHNGRFAITPEYPNGVYAYFATINVNASNESVPRYPYVVGPYFYNKPIDENFLPLYNQDFNVFDTNLTRNVGPYYTNRANSYYELIDQVRDEYKQEFSVTSINSGKIDDVVIFSSGDNYKIDDPVDIDITETDGIQSNIVVSELEGREIESFLITEDLIEDLEFFIRTPNTIVKTSSPHSIKNGQPVVISGLSTITSSKFEGVQIAEVIEKESVLLEDIPDAVTTGLSTFIKVKDLNGFKVNDFIGIGSETLLITNIDFRRSGFNVNRIENTGIHTVGVENVVLLPREFRIPTGDVKDYTFENYTTFFDPKDSIGIGSTGSFRTVVGFGTSSSEDRFIPARSIYLPSHKFYTGQPLIYNSGSGFAGTSLYVNNPGIGVSFKLEDNQIVYAVNLGQDYIGLSTLGFTSSSGIGTNNNSVEFWNQEKSYGVIGAAHSLTTLNPRITGSLQKTLGIVTTTSDHNLQVGDTIKFNVTTNYNEVVKVIFDSVNRKVLMREVSFSDSDVSLSDSSIDISSYTGNIETGDKVVYYSQYPINGLTHYGIYYVLKTSFNSIKLCQYRSDIQESNFINFSSIGGSSHKLYFINPQISCIRTTKIEFDLSDSSLTNLDLQFYYDVNFVEKINERTGFFVEREGIPGSSGAKVILDLSAQFFPIYYNLLTRGSSEQSKTQISTDKDVLSNNKISIINHQLNSNFIVNSITDDNKSFTFFNKKNLTQVEKQILTQNLTTFSYKTTSTNALGPISKLKINFPGRGYKKTPKVREIKSDLGKNAVVKLVSPNIGKVETFTRVKDGFDYPTDPTLSPSLSVPTIVGVKDIRTIDYIGITTGGKRYNSSPKLIIRNDPNGIELSANVSGGSVISVDVIKNSTSIAKPLEIISIFNSNGYDIDTISVAGDLVTLELSNVPGLSPFLPTGFGKTEYVYPFKVGDKIFIENCRLTDSTSGDANYNSSSYSYSFFDVVGINTTNNTVTYNMAGISTGSFGTYSDEFNLGVVINKNDMPVFEMVLKDDVNYLSNEKISSPRFSGLVMENGWDGKLNQMRLKNVSGDITIGDKIFGETSKITGTVEYFDKFNLFATLGVSRDKTASIDLSSGILNEYSQRISDNFYYQKFSYSIKGNIPYNVWRESVRSIVHPSGFKEFSDLEVFTEPTLNEVNSGIAKSTDMKPRLNSTDSFTFINIDNKISFNTKKNFARVYEEELLPDGSTQNVFFDDGVDLSSFILNKTNKVLVVDDISDQFDGTSRQYLRGRFADASDLLKLNREFIQAEVVAFVEYNYPNIGLSTTYSQEKCKRDVGYIVDAVAHDIKYNSNNKSVEAGVYYWDAGVSYVSNETEETLFAYNYVKFISQYVINNQSPPTLYQTTVDQEFNFSLIPDPLNPDLNRYKDARNLILANKREILDKSLASVGIGFPDFYFPGDAQTNSRSRYYDGYRLIQLNRQEIIDTAWSNTLSIYPGISTTVSKCKRDLGYFVDAVSIDVFTGGNNYSRQFTLQYFENGIPITNGLVGEEAESIFAFCQARDLMRSAIRNGLTIKDVGITSGPATYGIGATVLNTSLVACTDVQLNVVSLVGIITAVISAGTTVSLPAVNVGSYTTGGNKCYRDLGYIVDSVAQDLAYGTNQHIIYSTKKYFTGAGAALTTGLLGEESESIYAFESAKDYIKKAITNQLYVKDLTITADPITGFNTDPSSCADVQTNVDTLVGILTVAIGNSSLAGIPTENYGTADCADVRSAIGNYVGIITTIIGLGTDFAPEITYPSLTRGGSVVGLTTFKLKNKGTSLFKHEFSGINIDINTDTFTIENHNFQTGQELLYTYDGGTPIGIGTTSYLTGPTTTLLNVHQFDGTSILENGYSVAISTAVSGISTTLSPVGPSFKQYNQAIGSGTTGTDAEFNILITYDISTGQPLSTSVVLTKGGSGFSVGETVSIAGTYIGGTTPTNDLSFVVSTTGPTVLISEANQSYLSVPSNDLTGATFNVSRNNDGEIDYVKVLNGGSGYDSNSVISIAGTYVGGTDSRDDLSFSPLELGSNVLPPTVFVYKLNDNQFKLSGLSTSVFLNLTGVGTATHSLAYKDPNSSIIVTIDGIIQKALARKSLNVSLASSVSTASTTILDISSGISSLATGDIINLDNELISVKTIGVSSETQIEVERGYFGSVATSHTTGVAATVLNGNFNIVGDVIYFDTAPYGKIGPVGLETGSIFGGRVFSRKFDPGTPNDRNILFDDISLSFTGIAATEFTLKVNGQTTDTVFNNINSSTEINNNPIVLINNVFQNPTSDYTVDGSGTNVLRFLSGTPSAGRISKVGVTSSYGYIPRVGAAATVIVSVAGTISDVVVTGGGSGYRGIPVVSIASTIGTGASVVAVVSAAGTISGFTIVNAGTGYTTTSLPEAVIGIPTGYSNLTLNYTAGTSGVGQKAKLTVEVGMGSSIISYKFDQPGVGYRVGDKLTPVGLFTDTAFRYDTLNISNVNYDNLTGITTITTTSTHNINENDYVILTGIAFTCGYDEVGIQTFSYDETTGICTVVTYSPHGLLRTDVDANKTSDEVFLFNLPFSCAVEHTGVTTTIFPDGTSSYGRVFPVLTSISSTSFTMNAGVSTIPHVFEGWPEIGISTFAYYQVTGLSTVTTSSDHEFAVGDKVTLSGLAFTCSSAYAGLTTTIFPDGTSPYGYTFTVTSVNSSTEFEFLAGISTIVHYYNGGGYTKKVPTAQRVLRYTDDSTDGANEFRVVSIGSTDEFTILAGSISTIPHYYTQGGIVTFKQFEQFILTVEEVQTDTFSGFYPGQFIQFDDISQFFNGFRKKFTLSTTLNGIKTVLGLRVPDGTDLNITNNIFIYINDVLQVPGTSYTFSGSRVVFKEAPISGSKCVILYYRGSSIDVELVDPPKTIKPGDKITIQENPLDLFDISQFDRVVKRITSSDQLETFNYYSVGIITDPARIRPLSWEKQVSDTVISGSLYSKSRPGLQSNIKPFATVIKKIQPDDTSIYVDNAYPLFTDVDELSEDIRDIFILENRIIEPCLVESVVSTSSSVSSINILDGGIGYANTQSPKVTISETFIVNKDPIFNWSGVVGLTTSYNLKSVKYKDKFISVGSSSVYAESIDGVNWQVGTVGFGQSSDFNSIESVGIGTSNLLVSVGNLGQIIKAIDYGTSVSNWEQILLEEDNTIPGLGAVSRVSSGYTGTFNQIVYSSITDSWVAVGAGGSIFVASGVTTDTFVNRFSETLSDLNSVVFGADYFVAVGNDGVIRSSNNGTIWEFATSPVSTNLNKVIYVDGKFVIVGNTGIVLRSIDRSTYEIISNNLGTQDITNIYYNYGFYVVTVSTGEIYYSFDLSSWIYRDTLQLNSINDLVFANNVGPDGRYIAVGSGATAIYAEPIYNRATAVSNVTNGIVTSIQVVNPGFGYDLNNPPPVLVEIDDYSTEIVKSFKVVGDHGIIVGIQTYISGTPGIGTTSPKVSFALKSEQYDNSTLGIGYSSLNIYGITNSQLSKGDYFVITDSNVETGGNLIGISTSLGGASNLPEAIVGVATQFLDGVYLVEDVTTPSLGIVTVTCNFVPMVDDYVILYPRGEFDTGINTNGYYGRYSWAKIYDYQNRVLGNPKTFKVFNDNGITGLSTSPKVMRTRNVVSQ